VHTEIDFGARLERENLTRCPPLRGEHQVGVKSSNEYLFGGQEAGIEYDLMTDTL